MPGLYILGGILIFAGIIWFFLIGRPWAKQLRAESADLNPLQRLVILLIELAKKLGPPYVPGAFMIVAGIVLVVVGLAVGGGGNASPTPTVS